MSAQAEGAGGSGASGRSSVGQQTGGLAARYASALYDLADQEGSLDAVAADLKGVKQLIADSEDFRRFLKSPVISRTEQSKGIAAIAAKAGFNALTVKFLGLVAANRRLFALVGMIDAFLATLARRRGEVSAEVTSAVPLSEQQSNALASALKQTVGRAVALSAKVDPAILGGLVVKVGSRMVDSSLKSKLQRLKLVMKGVG
ncbi:MAG: F0F1 ATP synthase subunit delta [Rhodobacteraceae bacterium]|nr:F0F1 ATP synthase subunit delta [Paracoccaceae bacterium]